MAITPNTDLKLLKVGLEIDDRNQINFASKTAQYNYFNSQPKIEIDDISYQRKDNTIRYEGHIDSILEYNYVMYKNANYSDKWFYAYITNMTYVNDNMTLIQIKTDVFQTWQFDLELKKSFVEREHVSDDTIGKHTVPENLETGEYIINSSPTKIFNYDSGSYIVFAVTDFPATPATNIPRTINGIYGGLYYIVAIDESHAKDLLQAYSNAGKLDYVSSAFLIPKTLISYDYNNRLGVLTFEGIQTAFSYIKSADTFWKIADDVTLNLNSTLNGYTPKNKKLFTYPYNCLIMSNNVGTDTTMKYEEFVDNTPKFRSIGAITPGCSLKCVPLNYKKLSDSNSMKSYNFGVNGAKFPVCSWESDVYTNWLTQNGVNIGISLTTSALSTIVGGTTGNALGVASGVIGIADTLSSIYQHSIVPEQTQGNINSGDITFSTGNSVFTAYNMCIRSEYAKIIDDYFSMYGYKVNSLKTPAITGRRNWNFIKTIDINIEAFIPQNDLQEIKTMFNNGITIWHNTSTFLDYSQNNDII